MKKGYSADDKKPPVGKKGKKAVKKGYQFGKKSPDPADKAA